MKTPMRWYFYSLSKYWVHVHPCNSCTSPYGTDNTMTTGTVTSTECIRTCNNIMVRFPGKCSPFSCENILAFNISIVTTCSCKLIPAMPLSPICQMLLHVGIKEENLQPSSTHSLCVWNTIATCYKCKIFGSWTNSRSFVVSSCIPLMCQSQTAYWVTLPSFLQAC